MYNNNGYSGYIYLTSQTWSYKALKIYSKFGFTPYLGEKPVNWKADELCINKHAPEDYAKKNAGAWEMIQTKWDEYEKKV